MKPQGNLPEHVQDEVENDDAVTTPHEVIPSNVAASYKVYTPDGWGLECPWFVFNNPAEFLTLALRGYEAFLKARPPVKPSENRDVS